MLDEDVDTVAAPQDWPSRHIATLVLSLFATISSYFFPLKNKTNVKVITSNGKKFLFFISAISLKVLNILSLIIKN
jgi:hypothetical protein